MVFNLREAWLPLIDNFYKEGLAPIPLEIKKKASGETMNTFALIFIVQVRDIDILGCAQPGHHRYNMWVEYVSVVDCPIASTLSYSASQFMPSSSCYSRAIVELLIMCVCIVSDVESPPP